MASSRDRERELARQRHLRRLQREQAKHSRRRRRLQVTAAVLAVALVVAGAVAGIAALTGDDKEPSDVAAPPTPTPQPTVSPAAAGDCTYSPGGQPSRPVAKPSAKPARADVVGTLKTSRGDIVLSLLGAKAPCTVNSFVHLAQAGFYDKTTCHRLTTSGIFVLQCGDPSGTGSGGPGYTYADENLSGATYPAGTVAMANAGPGTNGSQFFLVYKDTQLPPNYTPFGRITKGLDVVNAVAKAGSDDSNGAGDGKPKLAITINDVVVKTA